jgi:hypothetical protein
MFVATESQEVNDFLTTKFTKLTEYAQRRTKNWKTIVTEISSRKMVKKPCFCRIYSEPVKT